jgi:hypothetical protein
MSELPMRGHFRYLRFKTFLMTPRTSQCEVFFPFLSSFEHSGVPEDSQPPTFPSVGLHPHTWPKWGCDTLPKWELPWECEGSFFHILLHSQEYKMHLPNLFLVSPSCKPFALVASPRLGLRQISSHFGSWSLDGLSNF